MSPDHRDLRWLPASPAPPLLAGEVHVWLLATDYSAAKVSREHLSTEELVRASAFKFNKDRERFVHCRSTLRALLAAYMDSEPAGIEIDSGRDGKPYLATPTRRPLHFNVSHSGDHALIAFSEEDIGVDIEPQDASFIEPGTLDICLSTDEKKAFARSDPEGQVQMFFDIWTSKEAYLKLVGSGLAVEPNTIDLQGSARGQWHQPVGGEEVYFHRAPEIVRYSAAIASRSQPSVIRYLKLSTI